MILDQCPKENSLGINPHLVIANSIVGAGKIRNLIFSPVLYIKIRHPR
jgi:hypothetical protein